MSVNYKNLKANLRLQKSEREAQIYELTRNISALKKFVSGINPNAVIAKLTNIIKQKEKEIYPFLIDEDQSLNPGLFIDNVIPRISTDFQIFNLRLAKVAFNTNNLTLTLGIFPQTSISVVTIINNTGGLQTIDLDGPYQLFFPEQQSKSNIPGVRSIIFTPGSLPGDYVTLTYINRQNLLLVPGIRIRTNTSHIDYL